MTGITGRTYLERGSPVTVITAYNARRAPDITAPWLHFTWPGRRPAAGPRNVAIRRADGSTTVRPFRGLKRPPNHPNAPEENSG
jgi:acetyl esterase